MDIQARWYQAKKTLLCQLLRPFSWLFQLVSILRKHKIQSLAYHSKLPVIVVGNITVGGTGKTPVVQAICSFLQQQGMNPAIVTRGYGGHAAQYPLLIDDTTQAKSCGDEPYMLKRLFPDVPIVVDPKRVEALKFIESNLAQVDVIISDDGLQHYYFARDIEIIVVDGKRTFGNGLCLPAGPLREPIKRLETADMIIFNGGLSHTLKLTHKKLYQMQLKPISLVNLLTAEKKSISQFKIEFGNSCHAVAGIGNPQRFFKTIQQLGLTVDSHIFPDHYSYTKKDFLFLQNESSIVIMTYKDAVKCQLFAHKSWWYLEIFPMIEDEFFEQLQYKLSLLERGKEGGNHPSRE